MKILWVANVPLPQMAINEHLVVENVGGWMIRLALETARFCQLTYIFPNQIDVSGVQDGIQYRSFFPSNIDEKKSRKSLHSIIESDAYDLVHVHGTEFKHSFFTIEICKNMTINTVISIQGLISECAKYYYNGLDLKTIYGIYPKDIIRGNIHTEKKRFVEKGKFEIQTLKLAKNVIGRTEWDRTCVHFIDSNLKYYYNSETLRDNFYKSTKWNKCTCQKHTIFMSQAGYPLKGGHFAIKALKYIKQEYPDVKLYIAGRDMIHVPLYKRSYYQNYLKDLIQKLDLEENVIFLGNLDEEQILKEYLKANVFVSASTIENSPNSICEAQILGVPVISSMVGGVPTLVEHGKTGYLYQSDSPYMLAHFIEEVFGNDNLEELSRNEIIVAEERHKINRITDNLKNIYEDLLN